MRIAQLKNLENNFDGEEKLRRGREGRLREEKLSGIKLKVQIFQGINDLEAYLEWKIILFFLLIKHILL